MVIKMEHMKKVGIMGGTFNPIHNGHILMAQKAYEQFALDEVLFMPSGHSYLKTNVLDTKKRVDMVKLAIERYPYFSLSLMEVERSGNTYTYETLQALKKENPDTWYFFIVGADSLLYMEHWKKPSEIFALATILCAARDDYDIKALEGKRIYLQKKLHADIRFIHMPKIEISSTQIRSAVQNHASVAELVPKEVADYMAKEHLYEED